MKEIVLDLQPVIAGEVSSTDDDLAAVATDFGGVVRRRPRVRIRPRDSRDIAQVVRYARKQGLAITCRAQGHSLGGQALSQDGILLDLGQFCSVHHVDRHGELSIEADAGSTWRQVLDTTLPLGLAPPVITNYVDVSLGGTHAVGGMGASSFRHGTQADNCIGLEVVTGEGELVHCTPLENSELFRHALGGYGQFGIISRVRHRLRPYRPSTRTYTLLYDELDALLADLRTLAAEGRADYLSTIPGACIQGFGRVGGLHPLIGWFFSLQLTVEADNPEQFDDQHHLRGLSFYRHVLTEDLPFTSFILPSLEFARPNGTANPWTDMFLTENAARKYIEYILCQAPTFLDFFRVPMGAFCLQKRHINLPMIRLPEEDFIVGFGLYPTVSAPQLDSVLERLNEIVKFGLELGGKRYLTGWINFEPRQWREHFGRYWPILNQVKRKYDPANLFNPGFIPFES